MASTATGRRLTEQHRQSQVALRARVVRQLVGLWQGFDPDDIDVSWQRIAPFVMQIATQGRQISEGLSATYYRGFRAAEGVTGEPPVIELSTDWRARAQASFYITGPVAAKALVKINRPDVAQQALVSLSGSLVRYVLEAGRDTVMESVFNEDEAEIGRLAGWRRVTAGNPCLFCEFLASRGAVYTKDTALFRAHDHCACTAAPDFSERVTERDLIRRREELEYPSRQQARGTSPSRARMREILGR